MTAELASITGPGSALLAGLVTSLHCAGMCGPLACALVPAGRDAPDPSMVAAAYHVARVGSYTLLGALAGGAGRWPLQLLDARALRWLPWFVVALFVLLALRVDRWLPRTAWTARLHGRLAFARRGRSRLRTAAVAGAATPLLPCGPLYLLLSLALLSGSALRGAETLLAFGLGTVPLLWAAQVNFAWVRAKLGPLWLGRLQRSLALAVALVLAWRLRGTLGLGGPGPNDFVCF